MTKHSGRLSGSREPSPSCTGLGPSGFDPGRVLEALAEVVYVARNAVGRSEWHRLNSSRPFDYEDFCMWVDHWQLMHPVVAAIAALQDREALLRAEEIPE